MGIAAVPSRSRAIPPSRSPFFPAKSKTMKQEPSTSSRREFLKNTGRVAAASALAGVMVPNVHAAENNTIQVALIGCGGRGTGAAENALRVKQGPVKLVAMADVFPDRLQHSLNDLKRDSADKMDVPEDRQFHRLRRLQEGHGLSEAGRRRHLCHAAGLPLGRISAMPSRRG